jgi:predicted PurR-regulated permease PerM
MITVSVGGVLIGILLIALIVLVVYLIILVSNLTDTVKKANMILDGGMAAVDSAVNTVESVNNSVKEKTAKVTGIAESGVNAVSGLVSKVKKEQPDAEQQG